MQSPAIAKKAAELRRSRSPVRQIMDFADPAFFRKIGLDPADVISFAGGWVNHKAPEEMRRVYGALADDPIAFHQSGGYSPTLGFPDCRQAVVDLERHLFGVSTLSWSQVAIGANSTQLTHTLLSVLIDPGDSILLLDPSYCNYPMQILTSSECKILRFPVIDADSWRFVADERQHEFERFVLENRPKVIMLIAPDNPTSHIPSQAFVETALRAAQEVGAFVLVDFAYKGIVFSGEYPKYFSWGPSAHFISIHSNSKWCRGLGRRLGWIEAPEDVVQGLEPLQCASTLCPDSLHQMALTRYVKSAIEKGTLKPYMREVVAQYRLAAERTTTSIRKYLGFPCLEPQGGLYTCMRVPCDGATFVERALKATGVLLVPGWGFGRTMQDAVRISFGPLVADPDRIEIGIKRLGDFVRQNP